jgi:hypothetical protein
MLIFRESCNVHQRLRVCPSLLRARSKHTVPDLEEAAYRYSSPRSLYVPSDGEQSTERLSNPPCDAQHPILTYMCIPLMATSKRWSRPPSPIRGSGPVHSRTLHFHFEHQEASPGRPRQTKSTHIPLTRSNRRHGQYVESCCAQILDGILIIRRVKELVSAQPEQEGSQERVRNPPPTIAHADRSTVAPMNNILERGCAN